MKHTKTQPNFWAVIPATVRYNKKLGSTAKLFFAEITALSNFEGFCWASNQYFSELFNISVTQVSRLIKELEDNGFVKTQVLKEEANKRRIYPLINNTGDTKEIKTKKEFRKWFEEELKDIGVEWNDEKEAFILYWTEKNHNGKKERWEMQKVFDIKRRWGTWTRNKKTNFGKGVKKDIPADSEIKKNDLEIMREKDKKNEEEYYAEVERSPEEQKKLNKKLAEMKQNLHKKVSMD